MSHQPVPNGDHKIHWIHAHFFRDSKFSDLTAYGAIQSVGRRETLEGPAVRDLTQPTILVTQDAFFALGMGCLSPNIVVKCPVSRHPLPEPPSRSPKAYETTGYRSLQHVLPPDMVDELCAVQLEGEENWEDIVLEGYNEGSGRRQTAPGTVDKWLPPEVKWCLLHMLADLFPVLDDLVDREPRLVDRKEAPPWRGYQWRHRDFMLTLRGAADTRVDFISLQDDPREKSLQIAPGTSHGYHTSNTWHMVQQKRGSVLLMDGTLIHRGAGGPGRTNLSPLCRKNSARPRMWWNRRISPTRCFLLCGRGVGEPSTFGFMGATPGLRHHPNSLLPCPPREFEP